MPALTPIERRVLRAKAHHLHPVVSVGHHGLTAAVLHEIDVNLIARADQSARVQRRPPGEREETLLQSICADSTRRRCSISASCWSSGARRLQRLR
jgi:RNA-binding protein YhbY